MPATKEQIVATLVKAYNMEVETVLNYLANSLDLEGVRAEFIKQALATDIQEELTHAQQLGHRIKQLGGAIPGSQAHERRRERRTDEPAHHQDDRRRGLCYPGPGDYAHVCRGRTSPAI